MLILNNNFSKTNSISIRTIKTMGTQESSSSANNEINTDNLDHSNVSESVNKKSWY